jgi:hypothetical protein
MSMLGDLRDKIKGLGPLLGQPKECLRQEKIVAIAEQVRRDDALARARKERLELQEARANRQQPTAEDMAAAADRRKRINRKRKRRPPTDLIKTDNGRARAYEILRDRSARMPLPKPTLESKWIERMRREKKKKMSVVHKELRRKIRAQRKVEARQRKRERYNIRKKIQDKLIALGEAVPLEMISSTSSSSGEVILPHEPGLRYSASHLLKMAT